MRSVIEMAVRDFATDEHIRNLRTGEWVALHDDSGRRLEGIRGRIGVAATTNAGEEFGIDLIEMDPGSAFPLHTHPGDHILYVVEGRGLVHVDGEDHGVVRGDSIFVPAELPHGVKTYAEADDPFSFLAVGHPHRHLTATDRMKVVEAER